MINFDSFVQTTKAVVASHLAREAIYESLLRLVPEHNITVGEGIDPIWDKTWREWLKHCV